MTHQKKSSYPRQKKIPTSGKQPHKYRSYLNEIRPTWKNNPDKVIPMIQDMVEKKYKYNIERPSAMEFIDRFMGIHERKIKLFRPEIFNEIKNWALTQRIDYLADAFLWFRTFEYERRYWIRKDFHLAFLDKEIKKMNRILRFNNKVDEEQIKKAKILEILEDGYFPEPHPSELGLIGRVFALIKYIDFLNAEKKRLLAEDMGTTMKIPIELRKGNETHEDQLMVQIPAGFFDIFQKEKISEDLAANNSSENMQTYPIPKYYTRSEAAKILGVSLPKLDQLTKEVTIRCHSIVLPIL